MKDSAKQPSIWTPANIVTCIRVVFVPVWVALALLIGQNPDNSHFWPLGLVVAATFGLLALTDKLDGYLARSRGEITRFGKFLDPIADKLVVVAAFLVLMLWGYVNIWVVIIVVAREFLVSALRMVIASDGVVIAASNLGKWKTATTMGAIAGFFVVDALCVSPSYTVLLYASNIALLAAVILTIWSGVDYFLKSKDTLFAPEELESSSAAPSTSSKLTPSESAIVSDKDSSEEAPSWEDVTNRAREVLELAQNKGVMLGTAESCTGGLVEAALTAIPGSSSSVMGAVGSYACSVKHDILGVENSVLESVGAVSSECAQQMAQGAIQALKCDIAVSVTGIAGPGGETPTKPVGLVWFGVATKDGVKSVKQVFSGDRGEVRLRSVMFALNLFADALN